MSKEMVISATPHETRVAILEEGQLCEIYVEREKEFALVGSIYKGKVTRVLPGMQSSFVDIGLDSDAFLYVTDFLEEIEDLDHVVTTVEDKEHKIEDQGGQVFTTDAAGHSASIEPVDVEPASAIPEALPGESLSVDDAQPRGSAPPPMSRPPQQHSGPRNDSRPPRGFQNRGRDNRGGFGRSSGGGGRGRGGRDNRGGRPGGDRPRFGRDLPHSKYASHRPYEPEPEVPGGAPAGGFVPVLLPGETLSRFKDAPIPTDAAAPALTMESPEIQAQQSFDATATQEFPPAATSSELQGQEQHEQPEQHEQQPPAPQETFQRRERSPRYSDSRSREPREPRESRDQGFAGQAAGGALEALPGETLRRAEPAAPQAAANEPAAAAEPIEAAEAIHHHDEFDRHAANAIEASRATNFEEQDTEEIAVVEVHAEVPSDLTEEEATALAEHVAEAQLEEAEREEREAREEAHEENGSPVDAASAESSEEYPGSEERSEEHSEEQGEESSGNRFEASEQESGSESAEAESSNERGEASADAEADSAHDAAMSDSAEPGAALEGADIIAPLPGETVGNVKPQEFRAASVRGNFRARMQSPARRSGGGSRDRGRDRGDRGSSDRPGDRPRRDDRGGGRRPHQGHGSHGGHRQQPRRTQLISDLLKQGQEIIVQIAKEPLGKKGARITSHVALPGRFLVYMPTLDHTGVSRKIASAEDRARLRHLVTEAKGNFGGGFIVRTAAGAATPEEVRADVEFLTHTWAEIKSRGDQRKAPSLLHRDLNLVERILRDYLTTDYTAIWVDNEEEFTKVVDFVSRFQPQLVNRVKLYTKDTPVFEEFGIQQEIDKGLRPKVWLKSGGYIVINHTEALVAIDVNTGKFVGKGSNRLEDTIVRTNLEAVKEIVRQMRLRDLGGIIVIDFIDMEERRNREKVMAALEDSLKADRAPSKVLRFNEFGLVAITRKRTKQALERTLCQPCPYCTGSGMVKSIPTLCYEIQAEARKMAGDIEAGSLTLRVHPEIAKALKTRESALMEELERWIKKSVIIQADPTLHWEQYDIY
jgi:Rne/Rng family ribonuclease